MVHTGLAAFDTTVDKTNHVLRRIEQAFGWSKDQRKLSYHSLRAALHALRDRLPVAESAQLAAQLHAQTAPWPHWPVGPIQRYRWPSRAEYRGHIER